MAPLLLGVDVGSTHCKAVLVDTRGRIVAASSRRTPAPAAGPEPAEGRAEVDAGALVAAALGAAGEAAGDRGAEVAAIGIAGMAETGVALDAGLRPLHPMIMWGDRRAAGEAKALAAALGPAALYATTGLRADHKYPLAKWRWLRSNDPDVLRRMRVWAGAPELVALALTGEVATEASLAGRSLAFDIVRCEWDGALLAEAGLRPSQVPAVTRPGEPAGRLTVAASGLVGVRAGTPVVVAGHDHIVGAYAAGVRDRGDAADSMGTAEAVVFVTGEVPPVEEALPRGITAGRYVDGVHLYAIGGLATSGGLVEWFVDSLLGCREPPAERYARFESLARDGCGDDPTGVIVEPYLRGCAAPRPDPGRRLAFHGVGPEHTLAHLAAGILEGTCFHVRWMAESIATVVGVEPRRVVAFGGGARNVAWKDLKAAVMPWPLEVSTGLEAVGFGAAILGGRAAGVDLPAVPAAALPADARRREAYDALYRERFLPIVTA